MCVFGLLGIWIREKSRVERIGYGREAEKIDLIGEGLYWGVCLHDSE